MTWPGNQGEWTGMCMCEQWRLHWTSQWGGRCHWMNMSTVWLLHSKWLGEKTKESASNFSLSLNIPTWKLFGWFRRPQLWATGDWQLHHNNVPTHASSLVQFFGETSNHPVDSAPLQPIFGTLWLLAFPQTKIIFEREEISDHWWDSGKYDGTADGDWENCVRSQGAYFEEAWGILVLYTVFLVSSSTNACIFPYCMAGYFLYKPHCILKHEWTLRTF